MLDKGLSPPVITSRVILTFEDIDDDKDVNELEDVDDPAGERKGVLSVSSGSAGSSSDEEDSLSSSWSDSSDMVSGGSTSIESGFSLVRRRLPALPALLLPSDEALDSSKLRFGDLSTRGGAKLSATRGDMALGRTGEREREGAGDGAMEGGKGICKGSDEVDKGRDAGLDNNDDEDGLDDDGFAFSLSLGSDNLSLTFGIFFGASATACDVGGGDSSMHGRPT